MSLIVAQGQEVTMAQSLQHEHWVYNMSLIVAQDLIVAHSQEVTVAQSAQSLQHEHWV